MELRGKKFLVIGLARTGRECARFLYQRGAAVLASDRRSAEDVGDALESLRGFDIEYRFGEDHQS